MIIAVATCNYRRSCLGRRSLTQIEPYTPEDYRVELDSLQELLETCFLELIHPMKCRRWDGLFRHRHITPPLTRCHYSYFLLKFDDDFP